MVFIYPLNSRIALYQAISQVMSNGALNVPLQGGSLMNNSNPHIRICNFEISQFIFLCDEVVRIL